MSILKDQITTFGEAAEELGTNYAVISHCVKRLKITPKPVPRNGRAKGLDRMDMRRLRRMLGSPESDAHESEAE